MSTLADNATMPLSDVMREAARDENMIRAFMGDNGRVAIAVDAEGYKVTLSDWRPHKVFYDLRRFCQERGYRIQVLHPNGP